MINTEKRPERFFDGEIVAYRARRGKVTLTFYAHMYDMDSGKYEVKLDAFVNADGRRQSGRTRVNSTYYDEYGPFMGLFDVLPTHVGVIGDELSYGSSVEERTVRTQLGNCVKDIEDSVWDEFEELSVKEEKAERRDIA